MKIIEILSESGIENERIEIDVPTSPDRDVIVALVTRRRMHIPAPTKVENPGDNPHPIAQDVVSNVRIPRPVWDNLVAALATQKASKR